MSDPHRPWLPDLGRKARRDRKEQERMELGLMDALHAFHLWDDYLVRLARAYVERGFDLARFQADMTMRANEFSPPYIWFALAGFLADRVYDGAEWRLETMYGRGRDLHDKHGWELVHYPLVHDPGTTVISRENVVPIPTWPWNERRFITDDGWLGVKEWEESIGVSTEFVNGRRVTRGRS